MSSNRCHGLFLGLKVQRGSFAASQKSPLLDSQRVAVQGVDVHARSYEAEIQPQGLVATPFLVLFAAVPAQRVLASNVLIGATSDPRYLASHASGQSQACTCQSLPTGVETLLYAKITLAGTSRSGLVCLHGPVAGIRYRGLSELMPCAEQPILSHSGSVFSLCNGCLQDLHAVYGSKPDHGGPGRRCSYSDLDLQLPSSPGHKSAAVLEESSRRNIRSQVL